MTATLPVEHHHDAEHLYFTADQMRAYRAEGVAAEREQCAQIAAAQATASGDRIADAIRARKDTK